MLSKEEEKINKYRKLLPKSIEVFVKPCEEGGFYAEIKTFPGCHTQAETFSELIEMVNDAVITFLEIPRKYIPFMKTYMPPVSLAQCFNLFPMPKVDLNSVIFSTP